MRRPRPWLLSEIAVAARAILTVEREAARARMVAGTPGQISQGSRAAEAVARRWGKGRLWLEWLLKVSDAATAEPGRLAGITGWMDRGGAPNIAWSWVLASRARPGDEAPPLPPDGRCGPIVTPSWRLSDVDVAGRALLAAALESAGHGGDVLLLAPMRARARALTVVASLWGERGDWLQKVFDVCDAASSEPESFGRLVGIMDKAGRPQGAWKRLSSLRDERRVMTLRPTQGRFRTLVLDPPWKEDNLSESAGHAYAQMTLEEIRALPVPMWAEDDAHLYLWCTNNTVGLACDLVESWGFALKSFHSWVKETEELAPKFGLGREFRNTTEHFIFARRGSREALPRRDAAFSTPTHHRWPVGANSEKPEGFYDLVRGCSYPSYGEGFQRQARADFTNLYAPGEPAVEAAE